MQPRGSFVVGMGAVLLSAVMACARPNHPPATPTVTEPAFDGRIVNPSDVHMESSAFSDPDPGDTHLCSDWEIWTINPPERVWFTACIGGVERVHTHLGDGTFENSYEGRSTLVYSTDYRLRVRHRDSSGAANSWSEYGERLFSTSPPTTLNPMALDDVVDSPAPAWTTALGPVVLGTATPPALLRLENSEADMLLEIQSHDAVSNLIINAPPLEHHHAVRVVLDAGGLTGGLTLAESDLLITGSDGVARTIYLPAVSLPEGGQAIYWVAAGGATYVGAAGQTDPDFSVLARSAPVPWAAQPGFRVEVVASGFRLPINIAFVPDPLPGADAPMLYVTELYGTIKVVYRDGSIHDFATNLLNFSPTGIFPGSGEQGLTGIAVQPGTRDVYASLLYEMGGDSGLHYPEVVRFSSVDGGRTASGQTIILDMVGELQGQSHQVSNLSFGPDGKLYVHMGDGFYTETGRDLDSFRGKVLRVNPDGSAPPDNPFYAAADGINARDYVFAYGLRNPFGGTWRRLDGAHYEVENGPSVDRFARVNPGQDFGYDGTDESMAIGALLNWAPPVAPVNVAFIESGVYAGSGFPEDHWDHAFVTLSGPTWLLGPWNRAKRIVEFLVPPGGGAATELGSLVEYNGGGRGTACALAAGPDGLYFSDLYDEICADGPAMAGARVLRIRFVGEALFHADIRRGPAPLGVKFSDESTVPAPQSWDWDFGDGTRSTERSPAHVFTQEGSYHVRLSVRGPAGPVVAQRNDYITVAPALRAAFVGGGTVPSVGDVPAITALGQRGFSVDYFYDNDPTRPTGAALAADRNLVVASSTISAPGVLREFRDVEVPLLFWEQSMLTEPFEALSTMARYVPSASVITLVDDTHPITRGLPLGDRQVYTAPHPQSYASGMIATGVRVLATRQGVPGDAALALAETGAPLLQGHQAPARRAYLFLDDNTFDSLTSAGRLLFNRSVCWASGLAAEFIRDPADVTAPAGSRVTLTALARGVEPVAYQWRKDDAAIPGATAPSYTIADLGPGDVGTYDVIAANACASAQSAPAHVSIACRGDYNHDGVVNTQDLFAFLQCFFVAGCAGADVNGDGAVNSQDFFDFTTVFFTPCP